MIEFFAFISQFSEFTQHPLYHQKRDFVPFFPPFRRKRGLESSKLTFRSNFAIKLRLKRDLALLSIIT